MTVIDGHFNSLVQNGPSVKKKSFSDYKRGEKTEKKSISFLLIPWYTITASATPRKMPGIAEGIYAWMMMRPDCDTEYRTPDDTARAIRKAGLRLAGK